MATYLELNQKDVPEHILNDQNTEVIIINELSGEDYDYYKSIWDWATDPM